MLNAHDKPYGRSEEYLVLRLIERFGNLTEVVKAFDEFYTLNEDWLSHLFAYEAIREAEEQTLATGA